MSRIATTAALREAIVALEVRRHEQEQGLASHFTMILDGLNPVNIIKNIVRDPVGPSGVQHNIINATIGLVSGYLIKKLFVRSQSGPIKKLFGVALQFGITSLVTKKGDAIKGGGIQLLRSVLANRNGNCSP